MGLRRRPTPPPCPDPVSRTVRLGLVIALVVLVTQSAIGLFAALVLNSYDSVLDLDRNNGIPDLLSTAAILAAAFGAVELAAASTRESWLAGERWLAPALALLLALVALDDLLQQEASRGNLWGESVIATLVTLTLLIIAIARNAPRGGRLMLLIGLCLLVMAVKNAYEYDQLLNVLGRGDEQRGEFDYELGIVLKQGLEFLGWSLVATGVWTTAIAARATRPRATWNLTRSWRASDTSEHA